MTFNEEIIPNQDDLFMRVHKNSLIPYDKLHPGVFRDHNGGMSTNWSRYADANTTKEQARLYGRDPNNYGVIEMNVGNIRGIENQEVIHNPRPENRAHTNVVGEKTERARTIFYRISLWAIHP